MSDNIPTNKRPEAKYEPGELDKTRRNIGQIDAEEARKMTKVLGGQVFAEKSAPIDYAALSPVYARHYSHHATGKTGSDIASAAAESIKNNTAASNRKGEDADTKRKRSDSSDGLPRISNHTRVLMDRIMMADEYKIKPNYGPFNFIRLLRKSSSEKVSRDFAEFTIKSYVSHIQEFITSIKTIIQVAPEAYKAEITTNDEEKFRFLRTVGSWNTRDIKILAADIEKHPEDTSIQTLIPLVKAIYRQLITVYFLGENHIPMILKEIYNDLSAHPKADKTKLAAISKEAITEWLYLHSQIIKGLYPLLMRMCSPTFEDFPGFFTIQISNILSFLGLTRFQIQMPRKKSEKHDEKKETPAAPKKEIPVLGEKTEIVDAGLTLLEQLFPDAGFLHLDTMPDLFPYFQPIYQFNDGFNMLSPENPMQTVIVLLRILEDFFQGCRNIHFTAETDSIVPDSNDTFISAINDWSVYREVLFDKNYVEQLKGFVNQQYTQSDFRSSQFGKKMIMSMLWQTKYNFLPHFQFEQLLLEKPQNDSPYRTLCIKTAFLRKVFVSLSRKIDEAAPNQGPVAGIQNPWERYKFDIPNAVSKRTDVLLGAKRPATETAATNANLIKYSMCITAVLDWWINNPDSPAYAADSTKIYRISPKDGTPEFSAPMRSDQNKLFAQCVKDAIEKRRNPSR